MARSAAGIFGSTHLSTPRTINIFKKIEIRDAARVAMKVSSPTMPDFLATSTRMDDSSATSGQYHSNANGSHPNELIPAAANLETRHQGSARSDAGECDRMTD
jgi:hypothetical protein